MNCSDCNSNYNSKQTNLFGDFAATCLLDNMENRSDIMLLMKATNFAAVKHKKQMRKDGYTPYINHPIGSNYLSRFRCKGESSSSF